MNKGFGRHRKGSSLAKHRQNYILAFKMEKLKTKMYLWLVGNLKRSASSPLLTIFKQLSHIKKKRAEMRLKKLPHYDKILIWSINLLLVGLLVSRVMIINNDKSPIAYILGYAVLISFNLLLWLILSFFKVKFAGQFKRLIMGLLVLFLPLLFFVIYG